MKKILVLGLGLFSFSFSYAAEVALVKNPHCQIALKGDIELGDAQKVQQLWENLDTNHDTEVVAVCLNSLGGDFNAALELSSLFLEEGIGTVVLPKAQCYSACAIAFMFGARRNPDSERSTLRRLHTGGAVGFHAPFLDADMEGKSREHFRNGVGSIRKFLETIYKRTTDQFITKKSLEEFFSGELLLKVLTMEPHELFLIESINDVGRWGIQLQPSGPIKTLDGDEKSRNNAFLQACSNLESWIFDKMDATPLLWDADPGGKSVTFESGNRKTAHDGYVYGTQVCMLSEVMGEDNKRKLFISFEQATESDSSRVNIDDDYDHVDPLSEIWMTLSPEVKVCYGKCAKVRPLEKAPL